MVQEFEWGIRSAEEAYTQPKFRPRKIPLMTTAMFGELLNHDLSHYQSYASKRSEAVVPLGPLSNGLAFKLSGRRKR
jgi:hypothetical protein